MLQTIAINNTLAAINDNIAQGFAAHDLGDGRGKASPRPRRLPSYR